MMIKYIAMIGLALTLVACQNDEPESLQNDREGTGAIQVKDSDPVQRKDLNNQQIARHLAKLALEVPNVKDATAVVAGPYAVVGIDVDKDLDRSRVGTIKFSVAEALKHDPYGKEAIVMADADGMERLRQLSNKMGQGHPIQAISDELSAIIGRYMPEVPIREDQPVEPDQNKETIPKEDQKELEDIENDQSYNEKEKKD
ncbi:YhcN/YlaJ family sporulation lipoprotein [Thalassobacillus hwangdonensis]|uniref:YhcN/YlaJ family sporulation lipoprotein n=1 Tax=Thalassobacillus hwangdonensis TaxID=546108 RepID=A0ABW3KWV3_9BACI